VLNSIDKELIRRDSYQGKKYQADRTKPFY